MGVYVRQITARYQFGFNGQLKDNEIYGEGNAYTAEFWEYDPRSIRRWNRDPVVKPWRSPYDVLDNSTLWKIDPNGDDDIFNRQGQYLGSTKKGSAVRVVNDNYTFKKAKRNLDERTTLITNFDYSNNNLSNQVMLSSIMTFYASSIGINKEILVSETDKEGAGLYYNAIYSTYHVPINSSSGKMNENLADVFVIINTLVHEKVHEDDPRTQTPLDHIYAVIAEFNHESFEQTPEKYKKTRLGYALNLIQTAADNKDLKDEDIINRVNDFNSTDYAKKYGKLSYDEKTRSVGVIINEFEIKE